MAKIVIKDCQQLNLLLNFTERVQAPRRHGTFVITAVLP